MYIILPQAKYPVLMWKGRKKAVRILTLKGYRDSIISETDDGSQQYEIKRYIYASNIKRKK